jgi:predicted DNA-binding WGR domain protein
MKSESEGIDRFSGFDICEMLCIKPELNRRRFYRLEVAPGLFSPIVIRSWGRIGCRIRVKVYYHDDLASALSDANTLYRRKLRRGYQEAQESLVEQSVPVHPVQIQNVRISRRGGKPDSEPFLPYC